MVVCLECRTFATMNEEKKRIRLRGLETPDWFLEEERKLLELSATIDELEVERRRVRRRIMSKMEEEGIRVIDSGLSVCYIVSGGVRHRVDSKLLKKLYPSIWKECQKEGRTSKRLVLRLR